MSGAEKKNVTEFWCGCALKSSHLEDSGDGRKIFNWILGKQIMMD
jgi:hypothetical protein